MARLREFYFEKVVPQLKEELELKNVLEVPRLEKVVINMGMAKAVVDSKYIKQAVDELTAIAGQKAVSTVARKSIAGFKLRAGQKIGAMVSLRSEKMYEFLDRLINIALPRVRDFRGLSKKAFDGKGNYSFGIKEQIVFPEIAVNNVDNIHGMNVVIVTSTSNNVHAAALLKSFNFPFIA
jgi:large subunit ribosomal protein L5